MEKQMQPEVLTLDEKKERWIHALRRKLEMRTLEEWDYETMSETIYKDERPAFYTKDTKNIHFEEVTCPDECLGIQP